MKISEIIDYLQGWAPLSLQEEYDNSGLQVSRDTDVECSGVLICLDVTEAVIDEAVAGGFNMVLSHHPLIYRPIKQVTSLAYQQRCIIRALDHGITVYSAHTCLDNAPEGVNWQISRILGLHGLEPLVPKPGTDGGGSGRIGVLERPESAEAFLERVKQAFGCQVVMHSAPQGQVFKVAVCGGSGASLLGAAAAAGADCYVTGELHYHDYFEPGLLAVALGHYESEHLTRELMLERLGEAFPALRLQITTIDTNEVHYL